MQRTVRVDIIMYILLMVWIFISKKQVPSIQSGTATSSRGLVCATKFGVCIKTRGIVWVNWAIPSRRMATSENCKGWQLITTWMTMNVTEFRQPLQVQSHLEMTGILVQLGHIQST